MFIKKHCYCQMLGLVDTNEIIFLSSVAIDENINSGEGERKEI